MRSNFFKYILNILFLFQVVSIIEMFRLVIYHGHSINDELQYIYNMWCDIYHMILIHIENVVENIKINPILYIFIIGSFLIIKYKIPKIDFANENVKVFYLVYNFIINKIVYKWIAKPNEFYTIEIKLYLIPIMFIIAACLIQVKIRHRYVYIPFIIIILYYSLLKCIFEYQIIFNNTHFSYVIIVISNTFLIFLYFFSNVKIYFDYVLLYTITPLILFSTDLKSLYITYIAISTLIEVLYI